MGQVFANTFTDEEYKLGNKIVDAWINLGKPVAGSKLNFGDHEWPPFDGVGDEFLWMNLSSGFVSKFKEAECNLWGKVYPG